MHISSLLFLSNLFSSDMIIIILVALVLFGGDKLPEIARGLGKGIRDFKEASEGVKREINSQIYSYEEKKAEEAALANQQAAQNQTAEPSATGRPPVENTAPVNESSFAEVNHNEAGKPEHEEGHNELVAENHAAGHDSEKPVV